MAVLPVLRWSNGRYAPRAALAGCWLNRSASDQVRYFGTWLQLFGIALVAQGVRELRRDFNRPSIFAAMLARLGAILQSFRSGERTVLAIGSGVIALTGSVVGHGRTRGTIEQRLDGLEREVDALRKDLQERERKLDEKVSTLRGELSQEKQERTRRTTQSTASCTISPWGACI